MSLAVPAELKGHSKIGLKDTSRPCHACAVNCRLLNGKTDARKRFPSLEIRSRLPRKRVANDGPKELEFLLPKLTERDKPAQNQD